MGNCGYYSTFIYMYAEITKPMYAPFVNFDWPRSASKLWSSLRQPLYHNLSYGL